MSTVLTCRNHPDAIEGLRHCARCAGTFCPDCLVDLQGLPYCATCKSEQLRDLSSGVDSTRLDLASIGRRFAAIWIDWFIIGLPFWAIVFIFVFPDIFRTGQFDPRGFRGVTYLHLAIYFVYDALMMATRGQTFGKMAMKMKVVRADGMPITSAQAWGRAFIRAAMISFFALVNYLPAFFTKERTCVHDLLAKSRVVNAA